MNSKKKNLTKQTKIGPVQLIAIGFPADAHYEGRIIRELEHLDKVKTIRILDILFVKKDKDTSDLIALSMEEEKLGAIIGALMGFEFDGEKTKQQKSTIHEENNAFGLSTKDIEDIGNKLEPGTAAGLLLIEHVWAKELKDAIRSAGGVPIVEGYLTPEAISEVAVEIEAMADAMDELDNSKSDEKPRSGAYM